MSRWRVGKHRRTGYWLAFNEKYDRFRPATLLDEYQGAARVLDTWRDAMDYADCQARTVEVVLPRIDEHEAYVNGYVGAVESDDGYVIYCRAEDIIIPHRYLKPLALALYSAHVKEKK
ncbi:hypothetical protein QP992_08760 [Corynebacterium ulcerans]|uniref:hypothetical protein n=1 Tax=Corynebacterium ulcerans TaxID=65058 RepID=UPI002551110A|nr:hypothetical protein [Corynebacterium ulcerans]MDK8889233.1 hypothetical protein [Corynebacterium ulcerans]